MELTEEQQELIRIIQQSSPKPSRAELALQLSVSKSTVNRWLNELRGQGLVDWIDKKPRTLQVLNGSGCTRRCERCLVCWALLLYAASAGKLVTGGAV